jgi:hypothetical protein
MSPFVGLTRARVAVWQPGDGGRGTQRCQHTSLEGEGKEDGGVVRSGKGHLLL